MAKRKLKLEFPVLSLLWFGEPAKTKLVPTDFAII